MRQPIYVTGTGTDIGKTHVLCSLLTAFAAAGGKAHVLKPVLSGFDTNVIAQTDTARLLKANGQPINAETIKATTPWRFSAPLSPDMAAQREGRALPLQDISDWCIDHIDRKQPTFIEGAGGLMSPIAEDGLNLDLLTELDAHPVLVTGAYLGTISHTLTALRAMDRPCTVIINEIEPGPVPAHETAAVIRRFSRSTDVHIFEPAGMVGLIDTLFSPARVD
jgi:dethiobiotin synthetase